MSAKPQTLAKESRRRCRATFGLFLMVISLGVTSGCCRVLPFIACRTNYGVSIHVVASSDANDGRSVQINYYIIADRNAFDRLEARRLFQQQPGAEALAEIGSLHHKISFISPNQDSMFVWTLSSLASEIDKQPLWLGIIGNFANPAGQADVRKVIDLQDRRFPVQLNVSVLNNRLEVRTF